MSQNISAEDLGLDISEQNEQVLFKWFLACYLFGKRIQQDIAQRTWEVFMKNHVDTPRKIANKSWQELVDLLGEGHYKRYDESMASNLHDMAHYLIDNYGGKITNMKKDSNSQKDFAKHLQEIKGVGPKTAEIFLREVKI